MLQNSKLKTSKLKTQNFICRLVQSQLVHPFHKRVNLYHIPGPPYELPVSCS